MTFNLSNTRVISSGINASFLDECLARGRMTASDVDLLLQAVGGGSKSVFDVNREIWKRRNYRSSRLGDENFTTEVLAGLGFDTGLLSRCVMAGATSWEEIDGLVVDVCRGRGPSVDEIEKTLVEAACDNLPFHRETQLRERLLNSQRNRRSAMYRAPVVPFANVCEQVAA